MLAKNRVLQLAFPICIFLFFQCALCAAEKDPKGVNAVIAIVEFQNKTDFGQTDFAEKARDIFESSLSETNKFVLVERKKIEMVFEEHKLGLSGLMDDKTLSRLGKLVAANLICIGSIDSMTYSADKIDRMKKKVFSVLGIESSNDWLGLKSPDDYCSSWNLSFTVTIKIIDVEKGVIVFAKSMPGQATGIRLRQTTSAPVYDASVASNILKPVMDEIAKQVACSFIAR